MTLSPLPVDGASLAEYERWQPEGPTHNKLNQTVRLLYSLYLRGYGRTRAFERLLARFADLVETRRMEEVARSVQQALPGRPAMVIHATIDEHKVMNPIGISKPVSVTRSVKPLKG